jgi:hypothetical protein
MRKFFACLLILVGVVFAATGGLCSLSILVPLIQHPPRYGFDAFAVLAMFGVIPIVIGVVCITSGWAAYRGK